MNEENTGVFEKNRSREIPTFANINLLGKCNVDCYFCLGKDIPEKFSRFNHINTPPDYLPNLDVFIDLCKTHKISKIYVTGQNTDALVYKYIFELLSKLKNEGMSVGLRTNGYLWKRNLPALWLCDLNPGFSVHSLDYDTNLKIMGKGDIPDWDTLFNSINHCRVSVVINRHNQNEILSIIRFLSKYDSIKYIQLRRICTDTRSELLEHDAIIYEKIFHELSKGRTLQRRFYGAECYSIFGKECVFWRTVKTKIGSINYYSDGTISDQYFVIEGYLKNEKCLQGEP